MWRPALTFISVILKWNSYTYVLFVTKRIFPTNSSECFDFITPQFIQFWLYIFIWKFKHTYVRFLAIFFIMCILAQWNTTVLPFPNYISCFDRSNTVFSLYIVDSIGLCDNSSDFLLFTKSAVLFYRFGPRFHAVKKLHHRWQERSYWTLGLLFLKFSWIFRAYCSYFFPIF